MFINKSSALTQLIAFMVVVHNLPQTLEGATEAAKTAADFTMGIEFTIRYPEYSKALMARINKEAGRGAPVFENTPISELPSLIPMEVLDDQSEIQYDQAGFL